MLSTPHPVTSRFAKPHTSTWRWLSWVLISSAALWSVACGPPAVELPRQTAIDLVDQFELAESQRATEEIDLGEASAHRFQVSGWADARRDLDGEDRRGTWTVGDVAELTFFVLEPSDLAMTLRCVPIRPHGTKTMSLSLNGQRLTELTLKSGFERYTVELPTSNLVAGWNRLGIEHLGTGQRGIMKDTRVLWDFVRFHAPEEGMPQGPTPKAVARPDGKTLFIPFGTRLDYYLDLPAQSYVVVDQIRSRGSASGRLEVVWQGQEDDAESQRLQDLSAAPDLAFRLTGEGAQVGRLSLLASASQSTRDQAKGILMHAPRVLGGDAAENVVDPTDSVQAPTEPATAEGTGDAQADRQRPNILVYLVDTLRADHLGVYGYELPTSPRLDAFAQEATVFEGSQAQTPWTRASVASMLTGMWPQSHGTNGDDDALSDEAVTLAEQLKSAGYRTAAITGNGNAARVAGFAQGFDYFKYLRNLRPDDPLATSEDINEAVVGWLDQNASEDQPFLLWVHTIDPHAPYSPPEPFHSQFAPGVDAASMGSIAKIVSLSQQPERVADEVVDQLVQLYDAEIAANDASFGALLDELQERGLYEDLVVVFLSDHGEEFYEHGGWTHGKTLHSEMLDTPLLFRLPGVAGGRSQRIVQHVDLMPTLLEVAGVPTPAAVQGRSFLPLLLTPDSTSWLDQGMAYLNLRGRRGHSYVDGQWKLIQYEEGEVEGFPQLYDRRQDRQETTNLAPGEPERARFLAALRRRQEARLDAGLGPAVVDEAERAKVEAELRALGYIQ